MLMAEEVFNSMKKEAGLSANIDTYNSLIEGYAAFGSMDRALALLSEMQTQKIQPNAKTWLGLVTVSTITKPLPYYPADSLSLFILLSRLLGLCKVKPRKESYRDNGRNEAPR